MSLASASGRRPTAASSILDVVGATPLLHLQRMGRVFEADVYLKAEHLNPGGSHKVRIAYGMVSAAEREGLLKRESGQTILEPTGGNTGVGVAMCCAVLGYRCVLVVPDNYSSAKQRLLRAYGAQVVLSDSSRGNNSHGERAMELQFDHPDWVMLNQGSNPANPQAHRAGTAPELLEQLGGLTPDVMVAGVGTGGHITGVGQVLRERYPNMRVVAVQPEGCSIDDDLYVRHRIQGLSIGYRPPNFDRDIVDEIVSVTEEDAIAAMTTLMRREGIGAGISTGANIAASVRVARGSDSSILTFSYDQTSDYVDDIDE